MLGKAEGGEVQMKVDMREKTLHNLVHWSRLYVLFVRIALRLIHRTATAGKGGRKEAEQHNICTHTRNVASCGVWTTTSRAALQFGQWTQGKWSGSSISSLVASQPHCCVTAKPHTRVCC